MYNDYLSLSANWRYRRKGEDKYTGTFTTEDPTGQPVTLDASILGVGTEQKEQRIGGGASFSTLRAFDPGASRLPLEVQFSHWQIDQRFGLRAEAVRHAGAGALLHAAVRRAAATAATGGGAEQVIA